MATHIPLDEVALANIISFIPKKDTFTHAAIITACNSSSRMHSLPMNVYTPDYLSQISIVTTRGALRSRLVSGAISTVIAIDDYPVIAVAFIWFTIIAFSIIATLVAPFFMPYVVFAVLILWAGIVSIHTNLPDILAGMVTKREAKTLMKMCHMGRSFTVSRLDAMNG